MDVTFPRTVDFGGSVEAAGNESLEQAVNT